MMEVVITARAESDLDDIFDYIATDNATNAWLFVQELRAKAMSIGYLPRAYPLRPQYAPDVRAAFYQSYVILFRVGREAVEILHFVHGARDLRRLFKD